MILLLISKSPIMLGGCWAFDRLTRIVLLRAFIVAFNSPRVKYELLARGDM